MAQRLAGGIGPKGGSSMGHTLT